MYALPITGKIGRLNHPEGKRFDRYQEINADFQPIVDVAFSRFNVHARKSLSQVNLILERVQ
jgi:hypothetical protein